jgi:hypothetical protein
MPKIVISQGQSVPSVAKDNGYFWQTLWNHPENAELKAKRKDPNVLFEGDELFLPEKELRWEARATEAKHRFKRKGDPVKFKIQLRLFGKPRANEDYVLQLDTGVFRGKTDGDGKIEVTIPGNSRGGSLLLQGGKEQLPIRLGHLNPVEEVSGVQQRLANLGFPPGNEDGEMSDRTRDALRSFQQKNKLQVTGEADDATKAKLKELLP